MLAPRPSATPVNRCELLISAGRGGHEPALERQIESAWRALTAANPRLFDGPLLSVRGLAVEGGALTLEAEVVGYREFVVQRGGLDLGVRPLAVTGVTWVGPDVLIGRRSAHVTQYPKRWEPVPAGSVAPPGRDTDAQAALASQLMSELGEEAGIVSAWVRAIDVVGVIDDLDNHVIDVCFAVTVDEGRARTAIRDRSPCDEHTDLRLCSADAVRKLALDRRAAVPTMALALELAARKGPT